VTFGRGKQGACLANGQGPRPVGSSVQDKSPDGLFDLGGNVAEWVVKHRNTLANGNDRQVTRGGDWARPADACLSRSGNEVPGEKPLPNVGFRCATFIFGTEAK